MSESSEKAHTIISRKHQGRSVFGIPLGKVTETHETGIKPVVDLSRFPPGLSGKRFEPVELEGTCTEDRKGRRHWINLVIPQKRSRTCRP